MMCDPCKQAGQQLAAGDHASALLLHAQCTDPNCTCQHHMTTVLRDDRQADPRRGG
jgi:hypothetical protein